MNERRNPSPALRLAGGLLLLVAVARFLVAVRAGMSVTGGDFAATLPGAYAERWNPTLWNSPDLHESWAFHQRTYLHGPTQFLTLFPIVFLDSYAAIARVLLPVYALLIVASCVLMGRLLADAVGWRRSYAPVFAVTLLYFPLLQALQQREFEVVVTFATVMLCRSVVSGRQAAAGAWAAYITGFKYVPVIYIAYFAAQRWWRAALAFAAGLGALFGLARLLLGPLGWFFNNNVPGLAGRQLAALTSTPAFCADWSAMQGTFAGIRWGLCGWYAAGLAIPPPVLYWSIVLGVGGFAVTTWWRLERTALDAATQAWRRLLEVSLVATVAATFFYTHYYYLSVLVVPLIVLLATMLATRTAISFRMVVWLAAYLLLSAGVLPISVTSRLLRVDWWTYYLSHQLYLVGELLLLALLLQTYGQLSGHRLTTRETDLKTSARLTESS